MLTTDLPLIYNDIYKKIVIDFANDINYLNNVFDLSFPDNSNDDGWWHVVFYWSIVVDIMILWYSSVITFKLYIILHDILNNCTSTCL